MELIKAAQQALEALEMLAKWEHPASNITTKTGRIYPHRVAVDAADNLRTAIEQAEKQEPVAYSIGRTLHWHEGRGVNDSQLYTTPPAAPVQEPVAWAWRISPNADQWQFSDEPHPEATRKRPLVFGDTTPPAAQRQPLTRKEVDACFDGLSPAGHGKSRYDIARAIEAAHGITGESK